MGEGVTAKQLSLIRHALGLGRRGQKVSYRNHFVAGPGHSDYADWQELVTEGHAKHRAGNEISGGDDIFWVTKSGAELALRPGESLDPEDFPA
jgi:hypothetical protein